MHRFLLGHVSILLNLIDQRQKFIMVSGVGDILAHKIYISCIISSLESNLWRLYLNGIDVTSLDISVYSVDSTTAACLVHSWKDWLQSVFSDPTANGRVLLHACTLMGLLL